MKNKIIKLAGIAATCAAAITSVPAQPVDKLSNDHEQKEKNSHYQQINLVSDIAGVAQIQDTNLVNSWGISFGGTGPIWVSDNGTGHATLYAVTNDAAGAPHVTRNARVVTIPGDGSVNGQLNNTTAAFNGDAFIFASEDGTISGWRVALGNNAEVLTVRNGAVYKGITLTTNGGGPVLLAANFSEGTVDEYDSAAHLIAQFRDRTAPAGYAPFNVQNVAGNIFVTFAKQDLAKHDDDEGRGRGLIDVFSPANGRFHRFAAGSAVDGRLDEMNSPWGIVLAPASFGSHADQLLVGNFGNGTIMAFDAEGRFHGLLQSVKGGPVVIDGIWGMAFGATGTAGVATDLYFNVGAFNEAHGLFGVLQKEVQPPRQSRE